MSPSTLLSAATLLLLLANPAHAAVDNDFSAYPSAAQSCLYAAASSSGCDGDTVPAMNQCLCGNDGGGWVGLTATCLGSSSVSSSVIANTYSQMATNCGDSSTPLALTREQFFAAVDEGSASSDSDSSSSSSDGKPTPDSTIVNTVVQTIQTTETDQKTRTREETATTTRVVSQKTTREVVVVITSSGSASVVVTTTVEGGIPTTLTTIVPTTETSTSTSTSTGTDSTSTSDADANNDDEGGLSNTAKIAIGAGVGCAALLAVIAAVYIIMRKRLQKAKQGQSYPSSQPPQPGQGPESHPMLGVPAGPSSTQLLSPGQASFADPSGASSMTSAPVHAAGLGMGTPPPAQFSPQPGGGGYPVPTGGVYKDEEGKWSPQPPHSQHEYAPQTQWSAYAQSGAPPQPGQTFAAELPDNSGQVYELGSGDVGGGQGQQQGRR